MARVEKKEFCRHQQHIQKHTLEEEPEIVPTATWLNALLLGIAMKLGGCTIGWNYGLAVGFGEYLIAVVIIGIAYLCLGLCMAEMISIMSFSGGYYGYARCAIGPFYGFLVGCCGVFESTFQMSISILKIGQFITQEFETSSDLEPIWWFLTFAFVITCHYLGAKWFWRWISVIALIGLSLIFIYLFGSIPYLNFTRYAAQQSFHDDPIEFFSVFRLSVLFFLGFDMLTLTSSEVIQPKTGIPKAMIVLISFLLILAVWLMLTVASQSPGITEELYAPMTMFPLVFGYARMFHLSHRSALLICILPSIATPLGYMHVVGKQVYSMAKSRLLPSLFTQMVGEVPLFAMLLVACLSVMGLFYSWAINPYTTLSRFATFAGCIVYLAMFSCYFIFNTRFSQLERSFRNPFGMYSAFFGILIFSIILIVMIALNTDYYQVTILFVGYLLLMTWYYYAYAEMHQVFSASEQKVFFKAYIVNMKRRKKHSVLQRFIMDVKKLLRVICGTWCPSLLNSNVSKVYIQANNSISSGGGGSEKSDSRQSLPGHETMFSNETSNSRTELSKKPTVSMSAASISIQVQMKANDWSILQMERGDSVKIGTMRQDNESSTRIAPTVPIKEEEGECQQRQLTMPLYSPIVSSKKVSSKDIVIFPSTLEQSEVPEVEEEVMEVEEHVYDGDIEQ